MFGLTARNIISLDDTTSFSQLHTFIFKLFLSFSVAGAYISKAYTSSPLIALFEVIPLIIAVAILPQPIKPTFIFTLPLNYYFYNNIISVIIQCFYYLLIFCIFL